MKINNLKRLIFFLLLLFSGVNTFCATNYRQVEKLPNESVEAAFGTINYGPAASQNNSYGSYGGMRIKAFSGSSDEAVSLSANAKLMRGSRSFAMATSLRRSITTAKRTDNFSDLFLFEKSESFKYSFRTGQALTGVSGAGSVFDLSAFKNFIAKTPGVDNASLTNLPKSFWDEAFSYLPENSSPFKTQVDNIKLNSDPSGKLTEKLVEDIMVAQGYKVGNGRYYGDYETARNGIDGFFYKGDINNPTEIIVIDSKQMSASGSVSLNAGNPTSQLPIQMKESWIEYIAINKLTDVNNSLQQSTKNAILNADAGFIQKYVAAVDKFTGELKFLKLGESF